VAPVSRVIDAHSVNHHSYADDLTLYQRMDPDHEVSRRKVMSYVSYVNSCFLFNDLQLNAAKSKLIEIGTPSQRKKIVLQSALIIAGALIPLAESVKIIGVTINPGILFNRHISKVCSSCAIHTKALRHIRPFLDVHTANTIACSLLQRVACLVSRLITLHDYNELRTMQQRLSVKLTVTAAQDRC